MLLDGDRDAVERVAVDEGGGAVDGVDDPAGFAAGVGAGFFGADGVVGIVGCDIVALAIKVVFNTIPKNTINAAEISVTTLLVPTKRSTCNHYSRYYYLWK